MNAEVYFTNNTEDGDFVLAFGRGLESLGWAVRFGEPSGFKSENDIHSTTEILVFWGLKGPSKTMRDAAAKKGLKCIVVELPYFRKSENRAVSLLQEGCYTRHNNNGDWLASAKMPKDRLNVKVQPSRKPKEGYILMCGQVPGDAQTCEIDIEVWEDITARKLRDSGEEVVYRPHPRVGKTEQSLEEQLDQCKAMVTYNSTASVDAIINGIPFWSPEKSQYSPMACKLGEWKAKAKKEREQFLANLAYCEFSKEEFSKGEPVMSHIDSIIRVRA